MITGGNGQLGTELAALCTAAGDEAVVCGHSDLDVADREKVLQLVGAVRPDCVLHVGAWTNVDGCESEPGRAYAVNALGTRHVAEAARLAGSRVMYVSSDYVFDGRGAGPGDGRSKLGGEREVLQMLGGDATIVRASWVCGRYGNNFVKTMLRLARAEGGNPVTVVDDQVGCPTFTADLAVTLRRLAVGRLPGVFHVSNDGPITWCGFAKAIFAEAGADPARVVPVRTDQLLPRRPAPRPAFSVLDNAALRGSGLPAMPAWGAALRDTVAALS